MTDAIARGFCERGFLTKEERDRLLENGRIAKDGGEAVRLDLKPVVMLFTPDAACTWLLTEIDPDDADRAYGLCDLGMGSPELGTVSLSELESVRGHLGLPVERYPYFVATKTIGRYALEARITGRALGNVLGKND